MKTLIKTLFLTACLAPQLSALDWKRDVRSSDFTSESHPGANPLEEENIRRVNDSVHYINNGNWISYDNFDFGAGVRYMWIEGASPGTGGTVELRLGSSTGTLIGSVAITNTGSWEIYKPFGLKITQPISGVQNLYFKFVGGTGSGLFNLRKFRFQQLAPDHKPLGAITDWVKRTPPKIYQADSSTLESHPSDIYNVRKEDGAITYINNGNWVGYQGFNFGTGANFLEIQGASATSGGTLEVRLGHPTNGTPIGSINISHTGAWDAYQPFSANLTQTLTGVQDLYFSFVGNGGSLFNIGAFSFQLTESGPKATGRWLAANQFDQESNPAGAPVLIGSNGISELTDGSWVSYGNFNFGQGANLITVSAATPNKGGKMEIRLDSPSGPRIATLDVTYTGSWTFFREYTSKLSQAVTGTHDVYVKFVNANNQGGSLFNLQQFIFDNQAAAPASPSHEGTLTIYDPVTGLTPSPFYTYSVQKVSALNAPLKQNSTNWLSPFAWFTECKTGSDLYNSGYYSQEIGGWSHTYCNFELGKNTPIVVKITRNNVSGAPSGPIFMANAHPAHKVESCEVINGEVYVTMHEPALITVDIDGQMDNRDAPMSGNANIVEFKPYANKLLGSHAVSIFANAVIDDKPVIGAPGVRVVNAGDDLPAENDTSWTTLYFGKGVHSLSGFGTDGKPKKWEPGDNYVLQNGKTVYIPGDAMVFGSFDSRDGAPKSNIRIYGHGTLSGRYIPHYQDISWSSYPGWVWTNSEHTRGELGSNLDRPFSASSLSNCRFEGVTLVDPANHGISSDLGGGNFRSWLKQLSWRANSDMGGMPGVTEDCFFRLQDDGPYMTAYDFRRNTLWFDCNGSPSRGSFMFRDGFGAGHQTVMEDCDIIYVRSNWVGWVFEAYGYWQIATFPDGTKNTGQHVVFRNIRVTDPRPSRALFGLDVPSGATSGMAGMRFENIEYRHPHTWGSRSVFKGAAAGPSHHCYFDGVSISGAKLDAALLANPAVFEVANVSDMVFRDASNANLTLQTSATNGSILLDPPGGSYLAGTEVTITAVPNSGYRFESWGGDLTGTSNSTTITLYGNKNVSAVMTSGNFTTIFTDNFNIADTNSLDGSDQAGRHTGLVANDLLARSGGAQMEIASNQLTFKTGSPVTGIVRFQPVALPSGTLYNFGAGSSGSAMLGAGGFRFEFDWTPDNSTSDSWVSLSAGYVSFEEAVRVNHSATDFGVLFRNNGGSQFFDNGATTAGNNFDVSGGAIRRHAKVDFTFESLADGSAVTAMTYVDNVLLGSRNFTWDSNNGVLYLELGNIGSVKQLDNISVTTLPAASGDYDSWATANNVTGTATDDDDSDGLTNFNEYAFGLHPTGGHSNNPIAAQLDKITGTFSYTRRKQSLTTLTYTVRSSSTLAADGWTTLVKNTDYTESVSTSGEVETVTITLTPAPTAEKLFLQVRAE
jgi:Carbohydrate binding module (family 6)/Divergent InlB B-repeat domain